MGLFDKKEPVHFTLRTGEPLRCLVCGGDRFLLRKAQLNTAVASFFDFDWANPSADCAVCDRCGHVHWFLEPKG